MKFTDDDYKKGLKQIKNIKIDLPEDPVKVGLDSISSKLAELQSNRDFVVSLLIEALGNKTVNKIIYEQKSTEYKMELDRLAVEDNEVKTQKSADARKAQANVKASSLQLNEHNAKVEYVKADSYTYMIQTVLENIDKKFETLSRHISATQLKAGLGMYKGEDFSNRQPSRVIKTNAEKKQGEHNND